jgi:hypothetical protein
MMVLPGLILVGLSMNAQAANKCSDFLLAKPSPLIFSPPGAPKILVFREILVSEARRVPESEIAEFLSNIKNAVVSLEIGQASIFSRMASESENFHRGSKSAQRAFSDIVDVIQTASPQELAVLRSALYETNNSSKIHVGISASSQRVQTVLKMSLAVGIEGNRSPQDFLRQFESNAPDTGAVALLDKMIPKVYFPNAARGSKSVADFLKAFGDEANDPKVPALLERIKLKVFVPNEMRPDAAAQYTKTYSGDAGWERLDQFDQITSTEGSGFKAVDLRVQDGRSYYSSMRQALEGKVVSGMAIDPNTEAAVEFKGIFKAVEQKFVRMPRMMTNPNFGGLEMVITVEINGKDILVPIYNGNSSLFVSQAP